MPLCQLPGADLYFAEKGEGEPLLFLNGLGGDHLYWLGQLRAFGKQYRCLATDNRDVGQSGYASESYTIADLAHDLAALFAKLQLSPAHIIGLSMGGMIAQEFTLAYPHLVKSLVLVNTLARTDEWFHATLDAFEKIRLQVADTASFFEAVLPWWVSYQFFADSGRVTWLRWLLQQNPHAQKLEGFLRQVEAIRRHDATERLANIHCPVLILAETRENLGAGGEHPVRSIAADVHFAVIDLHHLAQIADARVLRSRDQPQEVDANRDSRDPDPPPAVLAHEDCHRGGADERERE